MTKLRRSLIAAAALVGATVLTGFAGGTTAEPVDCRVVRCVALTFDGGPGPRTGAVLDALAEAKAPAAFFVAGKGPAFRYWEVLRRIADEGHEVGNHTWTQPRLTEVPVAEARRQLVQTQRVIEQVTGRRAHLMRPPQGQTNRQVGVLCRELGLVQVGWGAGGIVRVREDADVAGVVEGFRERGFVVVPVERVLAARGVGAGRMYP
ncbi:polysaccharide deacetylase family protein [Streptomyces finlayi]|uniref:polysaccharide deacetylase family protein n=1 Tax=Streptomyces finlayi TaxID=67296 RepID=UPI00167A8C14|nr:polysaccharide deacetylase family protein [Streptomyces finlayi]